MIGRIRTLIDTNPFDDADDRRKWEVAREISDGTVEAVHYAAWLDGPRRSHSLFEGYRYEGTDQPHSSG